MQPDLPDTGLLEHRHEVAMVEVVGIENSSVGLTAGSPLPLYKSKPAFRNPIHERASSESWQIGPFPPREILATRRYDRLAMLKIEAVKWRGKCPRHPMFDPKRTGPEP
jgi:hypothetical protein